MYLRSDKPLLSLKAELSPQRRSTRRRRRYQNSIQDTVAGTHDRRYARPLDRVEHHSQSEPSFQDRRHLVDQAGKSAWDWWSGDTATGVSFTPGMNTDNPEALHRVRLGFRLSLHADRRRMGPSNSGSQGQRDYADPADITRFNPNVDIPGLLRYAKEKNVRIWLWSHWTSVDKYMDQAFPLFEQWGVAGVKIDFMNRDDQWMVDWYRRVVEKAAEHHLMIDLPRRLQARWPAPHLSQPDDPRRRDGQGVLQVVRPRDPGPQHHTSLHPDARRSHGLHPGRFQQQQPARILSRRNVMPMSLGTRAQELALYVVFESPLEMVSDYPESIRGRRTSISSSRYQPLGMKCM